MSYPDGEAQKRVYERLAAVHRTLELAPDSDLGPLEELVELARTLAKGGPYASTVERWARDHGYSQTQRSGSFTPAEVSELEAKGYRPLAGPDHGEPVDPGGQDRTRMGPEYD